MLLFTIPYVQSKAANIALDQLEDILKTECSVDKIRLKFFHTVSLKGLYVEDLKKDTLLYAGEIDVKIGLRSLLNRELVFNSVALSDVVARVNRADSISPFNFQFIIDAFNSDKESAPSENPLAIRFQKVSMSNGDVSYNILSEEKTPNLFNHNNIHLTNLNIKVKAPSIDFKALNVDVNHLSFLEKESGANIKKLKGEIRSEGDLLSVHNLVLDLDSSQVNVADAFYNLSNSAMNLKMLLSNILPSEVAMFFEPLSHFNEVVNVSAEISGSFPEVVINRLDATYADRTVVKLTGAMGDCLDYENSPIMLNLEKLYAPQADLVTFYEAFVPPIETVTDIINMLGDVSLTLKTDGSLKNLSVTTLIEADPGNIALSGKTSIIPSKEIYSFDGTVKSDILDISPLLNGVANVDNLSFDIKCEVEIDKTKPFYVKASGVVPTVHYNAYEYDNLSFVMSYIDDELEANVECENKDNSFEIQYGMSLKEQSDLSLFVDIRKLYLPPFVVIENRNTASISTKIEVNLSGLTIDQIEGYAKIENLKLFSPDYNYELGDFHVESFKLLEENIIKVESSFINGQVKGRYLLSTVGSEIMGVLSNHLPSIITQPANSIIDQSDTSFDFSFDLGDTRTISEALSLPIRNVAPANIEGDVFLYKDYVSIAFDADHFMIGGNDIYNSELYIDIKDKDVVSINAKSAFVQDGVKVFAGIKSSILKDTIDNAVSIIFNSPIIDAKSDIFASIDFSRTGNDTLVLGLNINPSTILLNKQEIDIEKSRIIYKPNSLSIDNFGLIMNGRKELAITGKVSDAESDSIMLNFNNIALEQVLLPFNINSFKGILVGDVTLKKLFSSPIVETKGLGILGLSTVSDLIGDLNLDCDWDSSNDVAGIEMTIVRDDHVVCNISGTLPTNEKSDLSLLMKIDELPLSLVQPFSETAFSKLAGTLSSDIKVNGKFESIVAEGWLGVNDGLLSVDYTGVTYSISDTIDIQKDQIGFENLIIADDNGKKALLDLSLTHNNFGKLSYRAKMKFDDFSILNNEARSDLIARGKLRVTGNADITGTMAEINGIVNLRNSGVSSVMIELPQIAKAGEYSSVIYVDSSNKDSINFPNKQSREQEFSSKVKTSTPISINLNLNLNEKLDLGVIFNPATGDYMNINGKGNLKVVYNSRSEPQIAIYGDYLAETGKTHMNLKQVKSVDFMIVKDSKVSFVGNPMRTQFDVKAFYQLNAYLKTLSSSFADDAASSPSRVPVHAILDIKGDLEEMSLSYDIELPNASLDVQKKVNSYISTEEQKIRQFAYLLIFKSFFDASGAPANGMNSGVFTSVAASALSGGLDALIGSVLGENFNISTDLSSETGNIDDMRMDVRLSYKAMEGRLRVNSNLSYRGAQRSMPNENTFMGEFEAEYDITDRIQLKAYNRANERYYKRSPHTQGVGIMFTRESNSLRRLLMFWRSSSSKTKKSEDNPD